MRILKAALLMVLSGVACAATGSISGNVLTKDGAPAGNAVVRVVPEGATESAAGKGSVGAVARSDGRGHFVIADVPAGQMNVVVMWTAFDGSVQRGQPLQAVAVKAGEETKLSEDIRMGDAPAKLPASSTEPAVAGPGVGGRGRGRGRGG